MSLQFSCSACNKTVKAPESAAGMKVRCPHCRNVIVVPAPSPTEETALVPQPSAEVLPSFTPVDEALAPAPAAGDDRRPCPLCGEMILADAVKCRFCGEIFDATLRRSSRSMGSGSARNARAPESLAKPPAIAMMVSSILGVIFAGFGVCAGLITVLGNLNRFNKQPEADDIIAFCACGISLAISLGVIYGSIQMMKLRQYPAALTASILSILSCGCLGLPFGIWALVVLCDSRVKDAFE